MKKNKFWTLRYALINISYFAVFCGVHAYASVFLLDKGFTNTLIGLLLALANVLSMIAQPIVAAAIDKPGLLTNRNVALIATLLMILGCASLKFINSNTALVFAVYAIIYMVQMTYQPIIMAMNFEYRAVGCPINFGLARGLGSAGFAVTSAIMGNVVEQFGTDLLIYVNIAVLIFSFIMIFFFKKPTDIGDNVSPGDIPSPDMSDCTVPSDASESIVSEDIAHSNLISFIKAYPKFMLLMLAIVLAFFSHNMLNDYLIQIIRSLGGNESDLGYATFIAAFLELPTMAAITAFRDKIKITVLLKISGCFFLIKVMIMFFATGMAGVYISEICQMFAYAILIPAVAYYADEVMNNSDKVKGQAYANVAVVVGGIFSSLLCGKILDSFGIKAMIATGCIVCAIGTVLFFIALNEKTSAK